MATHDTVIIGAGPTGLSAAYHIGREARLLEQHDRVGGWCRSIADGGFTFDYAGHIMFSNDPYVHQLYRMLVGDNVHWQEREAWIYSKGTYTRYPFQGSLYGLPPKVVTECIVGAIEARFGSITRPETRQRLGANRNGRCVDGNGRNGRGAGSDADHCACDAAVADHCCAAENGRAGPDGRAEHVVPDHRCAAEADRSTIDDCCADGVLEATASLGSAPGAADPAAEPRNFEEFIYRVWGRGIAEHFAVPYNRKLWAVPLAEMETSWLGGRVPLPDLAEMIAGAIHPTPKPMGPNARFGYVLRGGFQALMDGFLPHLTGALELGARVERVSLAERRVWLADGGSRPFTYLVSTMPLPVFVRLLGDEAPPGIRAAAAGLRHVSVRCVNLGVGREQLTEKHWIYYPEDTVFHRIFVQGNASPHCNAPGGFGLTCEISHAPQKPLPCEGEDLVRRCIDDCRRVGLIRADDPIWVANQVELPYAYVVYDHARASNVATIRAWLAARDVVLAGRYSEWAYYNSDHAFLAGRTAAEAVAALRARDRRRPAARCAAPHREERAG